MENKQITKVLFVAAFALYLVSLAANSTRLENAAMLLWLTSTATELFLEDPE